MGYKTKEEVQKRVQEHYDWAVGAGYEVVGVFLQGSFNYEKNFGDMTDEESDVDTKCLVLPSFRDFCLGKKMVSTTHVMENNEHCDVKDLRLYMNCFKKQNVNFVEVLFTDYFVLNPKYEKELKPLFDNREAVARYDVNRALNCMVGMAYEKQKAMCHPYEGLKEKLEKYGYDGKQLSHCMRLAEVMQKYMKGAPYKECLMSGNGKLLTAVKRNKVYSLEEAKKVMDVLVDKMHEAKEYYFSTHDPYVKNELNKMFEDVVVDCMTKNFKTYLQEK